MSASQDKLKSLAQQVKQAMKELKAAEAKLATLSDQLMQAAAKVKAESTAVKTIVEYPSGRYECKHCRHGVLFTEAVTELPACDNCGSIEYTGHEPKVTEIKPPPPKRYPAGMYQCASCSARIAIAMASDDSPVCDYCGANKVTPI